MWLAKPTYTTIAIGSAIAARGLLVRALASGRVRKNEQLTTTGPYAHTRNPLYLGSVIIGVGFVLAGRSWWIALLTIVMFWAVYFPVIHSEEEFLRQRFPEFDDYARNVPRLFPRWHPYESSSEQFSWHLYWKHREYNAALGWLLMVAVLVAKAV